MVVHPTHPQKKQQKSATRDGRVSVARPPVIKMDPEGRCAVILIYGLKFVVIRLATDQSATATSSLESSRQALIDAYYTV